jgi:small subunit ribosomal protein S18
LSETTEAPAPSEEAPSAPATQAPSSETSSGGAPSGERGGDRQERPRRRGGGGRFGRRRVCSFCVDKVESIDYKEPAKLRRYVSDRGKIEPRRKTGTCARHQRMLTMALKRARHVALLPFTAQHIQLTGVFPSR